MKSDREREEDQITNLIEQIYKLEIARQNHETSVMRKKDPAEIKKKADMVSVEENKLSMLLNESSNKIKDAYAALDGNYEFIYAANKKDKERLLRQEMAKQAPQPPSPKSPRQPVRADQIARPIKSASEPSLSEAEIEFRSGFLELKWFVEDNSYYRLRDLKLAGIANGKTIGAMILDVHNAIIDNKSTYKNEGEVRQVLCLELNKLIGNNVPSTDFFKSKEKKQLDAKLTKLAMCIQQLGGKVDNLAYAKLAEKEFAKKKNNPETLFNGGQFKSEGHIQAAKQSQSYPQYKK